MRFPVLVGVLLVFLLVLIGAAPAANAKTSCTRDNWIEEEVICTPEGKKVGFWEGESGVSLSFRDCGPAKLELGKQTYRTEDTCEAEWAEPSHDGFLFFFQKPKWWSGHYIVSVSLYNELPNLERTIPMRVHYGGMTIRRWLSAEVTHHGARKIWEGTDAFINVCIDNSLELRSYGGRLYCETGGWVYRALWLKKSPG